MRGVANGAFLIIMGAIAALFLGGMEGGHIALADHNEKDTKVLENSHINVQTDTGQRQDCETAGGTSPISGSCTASSSNTISQGPVPSPPSPTSPCTPTMHPTVLTLTVTGNLVTGTLTDTCTGSGLSGFPVSITFR